MNQSYQELAERILIELPELEQTSKRIQHVWDQYQRIDIDDPAVYLDSTALNLHGFYSGLERLFELTARHVDRSSPSGENWHRDLIRAMATELAQIRPAVIGEQSARRLDELRRFRHLVRNVYAITFDAEKIAELISTLPDLWGELEAELTAFADFLETIAQSDQTRD